MGWGWSFGKLPLFFLLLGVPLWAWGTPPLVLAADVGEPGMQVWWREGDLLVGTPGQADRPGMRPLSAQRERLQLPADLTGWTLLGPACQEKPSATGLLGEQRLLAEVVTDPTGHQIARVRDGQRVLAENTLGRPAGICALHLVEADALPGLELLILWTLGEGEAMVRGLTVFRVPELARY